VPHKIEKACGLGAGKARNELPANWREPVARPELAQIGDELVRRQEDWLLLVPPRWRRAEYNWVIRPGHPYYPTTIVHDLEPVMLRRAYVSWEWGARPLIKREYRYADVQFSA
jgi:hypothetical protein